MTHKIGVFGSSVEESEETAQKARLLGEELGKAQVIVVITGACSGLPYIAAYSAFKHGVQVWGFSPCKNFDEQKVFTPSDDLSIYHKLVYVEDNFKFAGNDLVCKKYRNVISTATCDAGIIIAGRWGTMNEFTNLFDMGKLIGVLTQSGGIADEILSLSKKIKKKSEAEIIFEEEPQKLVGKILQKLKLKSFGGD